MYSQEEIFIETVEKLRCWIDKTYAKKKKRKLHNIPMTIKQAQQASTMRDLGMSYKDIGSKINYSGSAVCANIKKHKGA